MAVTAVAAAEAQGDQTKCSASLDVESGGDGGHSPAAAETDYSRRANWLRAAVLGANDGLVSTASLMMGVGAIKTSTDTDKAMLVSGLAGLLAGACSMAIGEFVSVYSQLDIEVAQMNREQEKRGGGGGGDEVVEHLPSPAKAAAASALAFSVGAGVPLVPAALVKKDLKMRLGAVAVVVTVALVVFGAVGAKLGKAPLKRSCARVLIGGWFAMFITFGLMKAFGYSTGL
ncbi:hypothetical protein H6P81_015705 [Aristolochia fimbriata]|uniref:Vacuolar iron transporter n=1 Tax=Aristolochia fimbriata TaxID=158543 RepID=A0AAV7E696_ARIFI|nr:hypothetical protein H6P81_015705 [Aristolochia fimbriata]